MKIHLVILSVATAVFISPQRVKADLILAADDFDAVAADFTNAVSLLNTNFAAFQDEINSLGGSVSTPNVFFPESLGADDLTNATQHLRSGELSLSADDFDLVSTDLAAMASQLNANFDSLVNELNSIGGSSSTPILFFAEDFGTDDLSNAAQHLRSSELSDSADDFDLVAADLTSIATALNANFDSLKSDINSIGGSIATPVIFFPEDFGVDDLFNAADHLQSAAVPEPSSFLVTLATCFWALLFLKRFGPTRIRNSCKT